VGAALDAQSLRYRVAALRHVPDGDGPFKFLSLAETSTDFCGLGLIRRDCCALSHNQCDSEVKHEPGQRGTLTDNRVNSVRVDQHGVIWPQRRKD